MGQHCWLLLATILTEDLAILKWSKGQFPEPMPQKVVYAWTVGGTLLVLYPILNVCTLFLAPCRRRAHSLIQFGVPAARRFLRRNIRKNKAKTQ